jgi:hypothetical protein
VNKAPVYLGNDLSCVPELMLEAVPKKQLTTAQWQKRKGLTAAAALHLNDKEEDGFLKALLHRRSDLSGVPFVMGDACRTKRERAKVFKERVERVRGKCGYFGLLARAPKSEASKEKVREHWQVNTAVAAQILPGEYPAHQEEVIRALAKIPRPEATRELTRVAVFSPSQDIRAKAIAALSDRPRHDATDLLVGSLRYPWPAVAENAVRAIVQLKRKDLLPHLEAMLEEPDPRGPRVEVVGGRKEMVAHELVRINHHRNCLLCHAPAERDKLPKDVLVAEVPVPSKELPHGVYLSDSHLLVRIDVTYLRQDFSALQAVKEKSAWPEMQRFDFVVRKRLLTPAEAIDLRERLEKGEPRKLSPYQHAAAHAIESLQAGIATCAINSLLSPDTDPSTAGSTSSGVSHASISSRRAGGDTDRAGRQDRATRPQCRRRPRNQGCDPHSRNRPGSGSPDGEDHQQERAGENLRDQGGRRDRRESRFQEGIPGRVLLERLGRRPVGVQGREGQGRRRGGLHENARPDARPAATPQALRHSRQGHVQGRQVEASWRPGFSR